MNLNIKYSLFSFFLVCISFASVAGDTAADGSNTQRGFLAYANPDYVYQYPIADTLSFEELVTMKRDNLAIVSGAGPAGLVAAATLKQKGYDVVVIDKRNVFTRMNLVNVDPDALHYFKKLGVLDPILNDVASLHTKHHYRIRQGEDQGNITQEFVGLSNQINAEYAYTPEAIAERSFQENSILAVSIADFQKFFYDFNKKSGVHFLTETTMQVDFDQDIAEVTLLKNEASVALGKPALIVVAEGAGSTTVAQHIGWMKTERADETWMISNRSVNDPQTFTGYEFVLDEKVQLAKVIVGIFSQKHGEVGLTEFVSQGTDTNPFTQGSEDSAHLCNIFDRSAGDYRWNTHYFTNQEKYAKSFFKGKNLIVIGDAAGTSSPISGLGFSLSVSAHAWALSQLLEAERLETGLPNYQENIHAAFRRWVSETQYNWSKLRETLPLLALNLHTQNL